MYSHKSILWSFQIVCAVASDCKIDMWDINMWEDVCVDRPTEEDINRWNNITLTGENTFSRGDVTNDLIVTYMWYRYIYISSLYHQSVYRHKQWCRDRLVKHQHGRRYSHQSAYIYTYIYISHICHYKIACYIDSWEGILTSQCYSHFK